MEELWECVAEAPRYEVSNWGNVRIRLRAGTKPVRVFERETGAQYVTLTINGKPKERRIEALVKRAFG